jgi:hypothetical protein
MAGFTTVELSIDQAAEMLRVQPETIRRRLRSRELVVSTTQGRELVAFEPGRTWLRVEDAGALLGLTSSSVRSAIRRGKLAGKREEGGRYRVMLRSVLEDRRCDPKVVELFGGDPPPEPDVPELPKPAHRMRRDVHVLLDQEELELLEHARELHGSIRAAVVAGLRAVDLEGPAPEEFAELRVAHDIHRDNAERSRAQERTLAKRLRERPVERLACISCEELVSIDEAEFVDLEDGTVAIVHAKHGRGRGGRIRKGSVMAHQQLGEPAP